MFDRRHCLSRCRGLHLPAGRLRKGAAVAAHVGVVPTGQVARCNSEPMRTYELDS